MTYAFLALASLVLLLMMARTADATRGERLARAWDKTLEPESIQLLDELLLGVREHRIGLDLCARALRARNTVKLTHAVEIVADFAPSMREGLRAMETVGRTVSAIIPIPAARPLAWCAWKLRGLTGVAMIGHVALATARERLRLRVWVIGCALALTLGWLRDSARRVKVQAGEWARVEGHLHDLAVVGDEAEITYQLVVASLAALAGLEPTVSPGAVIRNL